MTQQTEWYLESLWQKGMTQVPSSGNITIQVLEMLEKGYFLICQQLFSIGRALGLLCGPSRKKKTATYGMEHQ